MDADQFDALMTILYIIGLVICFALGAVHGHQR